MALTQEPQSILTDPLALRFMTGDQMGYMPQAQYLTPSEYGAFRTVPDPARHNYLHQDPGLLQSLLIRTRGSLGFMPAYTWNTYNPAVNMQQYMYSMNAKSDDGLAAGVGAVLDTFNPLSIAAGFALGGIPGFAAGMMMPGVSRPFLDRIRDMRGIQNISMSKIVGGSDLNQATGAGFNAVSARSLDSFLRLQSSVDAFLKQGDWRKLLELGVENGQFDYAGNVEQYKDALKKLRKSVTTIMEVAGSTDFKDLMKEYKRMRTMGADINEYVNIARKEDMYSRITGMRHEDMVNTFGQQGALIYQQAGLTGYQGSLQSMHNAASITLMQRTGLLSPGSLSRYGGLSGMTQAMTQQSADAQNKIADFMLPYFMKDDASGLDDSASMTAVLNSSDPLGMLGRAAGRKTRTLEQRMRFDHNRGDLMQKFQERYGQETIMAVMALQTGKQAHLKGIEAMEFGYRQLGFDPNIAHLKAKTFASSDFREQEERELTLARRKQMEERAVAESPFRKLALALDKAFTRAGENIFGSMATAYAGWSEQGAANREGDFNAGNAQKSAAWQREAENAQEQRKPPSKLPTPHPVKDLKELSAPASRAISGGKADYIGWDEKKGTQYGELGIVARQEKDGGFIKWLKAQGGNAAAYGGRLEAAGGLQDFASAQEAEDSWAGKLWKALSLNDDFNELQRRYVYEQKYKPAISSLEPGKRAEIMASKSAQQLMFMASAQSASGSGEAVPIGDYMAHFESGTEGIYNVDYDSGGGTSYGKWQLSSKQGSYGEWLDDLEAEGGKAAEIAKRLRESGKFNTGSREGAAVDAYLREARANPELFERTQRESLYKRKYKVALGRLGDKNLKTMIENSRALRETLFSTAVQHGEGGASSIFNAAWEQWQNTNGATQDDLIKLVYAGRTKAFPTTRTRYAEEMGEMLALAHNDTPTQTSDVSSSISAKIAAITRRHEYRKGKNSLGVRYHMNKPGQNGPRSIAERATDCSGWVTETATGIMEAINSEIGAEVFSPEDIRAFRRAGSSENIISTLEEISGKPVIEGNALSPQNARGGMVIGIDSGDKGWDRGRKRGIDHIVQTFYDENGELMISESSSGKGGVAISRYSDWWEKKAKNWKLYGVDLTSVARKGAGVRLKRASLPQNAAADILDKALRKGNGRLTEEGISEVMDEMRAQAANNPDRMSALDDIEKMLRQNFRADGARRENEDKARAAEAGRTTSYEEEIAKLDQKMFEDIWNFERRQRDGKNGEGSGDVDVAQLTQVLSRYDSNTDKVDGAVNYEGLADLVSETVGKNRDGSERFNRQAFINEVKKGKTVNELGRLTNRREAKKFVAGILQSPNVGMSKEEAENVANDDVLRAALISSSLHAMGGEDAAEVRQGYLNKSEQYEKRFRHNQLAREQRFYKDLTREGFNIALPGVENLGSEYKQSKENLFKRAHEGENSSPLIMNLSRLVLLKNLSQDSNVGEHYTDQFKKEAGRLGFTSEWIDKQLKNGNDITWKDIRGGDKEGHFAGLITKSEDMDDIYNVAHGLYEQYSKSPESKKDVIDKYEANLVAPNARLLKQQAQMVGMRVTTWKNLFARRIGMESIDTSSASDLKELERRLVKGKIGAVQDREVAAAILQKAKNNKKISDFDFLPPTALQMNSADGTTYTALNVNREAQQTSAAVAEETRQQGRLAPEQKNSASQAGTQEGTPLRDETVRKLNDLLLVLNETMKKVDTTLAKK